MNLLPSVLSSLRLKYFTTLLAALFAFGEPFNDLLKMSSTFHTTCCTSFERVWPDLNIPVEMNDVLFNAVSLPIIIMKHSLSLIKRATNACLSNIARSMTLLKQLYTATLHPRGIYQQRL